MNHIRLAAIRAIVFDLDDTLYCERDFVFSGYDAVAAWLRERGIGPADAARRLRELYSTEHRGRVFDQLLAENRQPDPIPLVQQMIECYRAHSPDIHLLPDAVRALDRWRERFHVGLISDGPLETQRNKVEALGLRARLSTIILTDEWGPAFWKPHRRAFEAMEAACGCQGSACVYLADNPAKDFVAPRQRGWRTVRVRRADGVYQGLEASAGEAPEVEVASLDDVDITTE